MRDERGFVLLFGLLIGIALLVVVMATYTDYLDFALGSVPSIGKEQTSEENLLSKKVVELRIENLKSGAVDTVQVNVVPSTIQGYRFTLMDTDYQTSATFLVENLNKEVYETVTVLKGDTRVVGDILVSITQFVYTPCESGEDC